MDAATSTASGAKSFSPARSSSNASRRSSASAVLVGDVKPASDASPPDASGEHEAAAQSWHLGDFQDLESAAGSVKSSDDAGLVKNEGSEESAAASAPPASLPVQKRRRVTRACDECRRKKIKCDGRSPCTHCSVYSYECTYDKPSNRRRNPAPQYIEALENRLQRAETLLRKYIPDVDLSDPKLDPTIQHEFASRERARAQANRLKKEETGPASDKTQDDQLMSMIESIGHLDLIDGSGWDFHGKSSGAVFLRRLKEQMGLHSDSKAPFLPRRPQPSGMFTLDSPLPSAALSPFGAGGGSIPAIYDLPPKEVARTLCYYSLNCATCLIRIVHLPSFYEALDQIYDKGPENLGPSDHRALALLYCVMALGCVYTSPEDEDAATQLHYKGAIEKGLKFYAAARLLLQDIAECRDLMSLQALLFMILFLQATSNLSGCYAFLGIALRAALRMGLHRHLPQVQLTPIEDETRRRVFYAIRQMDVYVSALLGFPILLQDGDIDQPLPTEVDDEYITKDGILTPPPGTPAFYQATNAHARLMQILAKVVREVYPLQGIDEFTVTGDQAMATYTISYAKIKDIEHELQQWYERLPAAWRPSQEGPMEVIRVRSLLRFSYAHVQMMLYRPFLHYASPRLAAGKHANDRYYACAAACISISRNIIHIGMEIRKQALLTGPYWFILYTEFLAILSLTFYVLENQDKPGIAETLADVHAGRELVTSLSQRSLAADRVTEALNALFEQLPDWLSKGNDKKQSRPTATKKRTAPGGVEPSQQLVQDQASGAEKQTRDSVAPTHSGHRRGGGHGAGTGGAVSEAQLGRGTHRMQLDAAAQHGTGQGFISTFTGPVPLNVLVGSSRSSPELGGLYRRTTAMESFRQMQQQRQVGSHSQMYKMDTMIFPSEDPFAYPTTRPVEDPSQGQQHDGAAGQGGGVAGPGQPDSTQHFNIEGQLLGPIPEYLMQPTQMPGLDDLAAQMYGVSNMVSLQQSQRHHGMGPGGPHGTPRQPQHAQGMEGMLLADLGHFDMFEPQYRPL